MKLTRRRIISIALAAIVLPGVLAIAFIPSSIEGVYNPLSVSSTMGCDCDQFLEFREGRMIYHVIESADSMMDLYYEKEASGSVAVRILPDESGGKGKLIARAEPHLLGTRFHYPDQGKSEWAWKRYITRGMKAHMAGAKIKELVLEKEGVRINTYDSGFKVLETRFRPKRPATPATPPSP